MLPVTFINILLSVPEQKIDIQLKSVLDIRGSEVKSNPVCCDLKKKIRLMKTIRFILTIASVHTNITRKEKDKGGVLKSLVAIERAYIVRLQWKFTKTNI